MLKIKVATLGAAALLALSGTAATAQSATPYCSKTVTDNCMQREGHAAAPKRHMAPKHHAAAKRHAAVKHRTAKHRPAPHRAATTKATPAPARKM